jgi:hypothetical protein
MQRRNFIQVLACAAIVTSMPVTSKWSTVQLTVPVHSGEDSTSSVNEIKRHLSLRGRTIRDLVLYETVDVNGTTYAVWLGEIDGDL